MTATWGSVFKGATFLAGVWLLLSPYILNFSGEPTALWTSLVAGAALVVLTAISMLVEHQGILEFLDGLTGAVVITTPFVLSFSDVTAAMWDAVIVGAAVVALAIGQALTIPSPEMNVRHISTG